MNREAYARALRSAAQLTFISALGGCGASELPSPSDEGATEIDQSEILGGRRRDAGCKDAAKKPSTERECHAALKQAFPNGDPDWYAYGESRVKNRVPTSVEDASLIACCKKVIEPNFADETARMNAEGDYRALGCCELSWNGEACTPWGPPMPPSMTAMNARQLRGIA